LYFLRAKIVFTGSDTLSSKSPKAVLMPYKLFDKKRGKNYFNFTLGQGKWKKLETGGRIYK